MPIPHPYPHFDVAVDFFVPVIVFDRPSFGRPLSPFEITGKVSGSSSYFSESEWNVMLAGREVRVDVGEKDGCRAIFSWGGGGRGRDLFSEDHERRRLGFELVNGKQSGGGGGAMVVWREEEEESGQRAPSRYPVNAHEADWAESLCPRGSESTTSAGQHVSTCHQIRRLAERLLT